MLTSFQEYKKPSTKEEEKEEFDTLYQMLQNMMRRPVSSTPSSDSSTESRNEIILSSEIPLESKPTPSKGTLDNFFIKKDGMKSSMISDDIPLSEFSNMFEPKSMGVSLKKEARAPPKETETQRKKRERAERKKARQEKKERIMKEKQEKREEREQKKRQKKEKKEKKEKKGKKEQIEVIRSDTESVPPLSHTIQCKWCTETFSQNTDYFIHLNTSDRCMRIMMEPVCYQVRNEITLPLPTMVMEWVCRATTQENNSLQCRYCGIQWNHSEMLPDHLSRSITCNRLAYMELKKIVSGY